MLLLTLTGIDYKFTLYFIRPKTSETIISLGKCLLIQNFIQVDLNQGSPLVEEQSCKTTFVN